MLKLGGKVIEIRKSTSFDRKLLTVTKKTAIEHQNQYVYLIQNKFAPKDFQHYLVLEKYKEYARDIQNLTILSNEYDYLDDGDIIRLSSDSNSIRVLFRNKSKNNSFLVTEQCDHFCLMCSQPPKDVDDIYIIEELLELIPLIPKTTASIGFTGGEPTLLKEKFLLLLNLTKNHLPNTSVHILSNGRSFKDFNFSKKYSEINHQDMMIGIPLYSDIASIHNHIVQSENAFDETILGILNLKRLNQKVEIRVVIHKLSIDRLIQLAEFIARNLTFVDHVALMGLEMMGFTRANIDQLWIDQIEYKDKLSEAVKIFNNSGLICSVYNHQLCLVNQDILPNYRKSISDWKNEYADECFGCKKIGECGGFFSSSIKYKYSDHIQPFK
jgi:His-Xaa-Ser system radical SAM maturase HxsC